MRSSEQLLLGYEYAWKKSVPNNVDESEQRSIAKQNRSICPYMSRRHSKQGYPSKGIVHEDFSWPEKKMLGENLLPIRP